MTDLTDLLTDEEMNDPFFGLSPKQKVIVQCVVYAVALGYMPKDEAANALNMLPSALQQLVSTYSTNIDLTKALLESVSYALNHHRISEEAAGRLLDIDEMMVFHLRMRKK